MNVGKTVGSLVAVGVGIAVLANHSTNKPSTAAAAAPARAQFELIISQSSCQETRSAASVNCSIAVKNRGTTAGMPTVYATYFYTDSGISADESDNGNCMASNPIPPGQIGDVYFCHPYNALQHDVRQAAVTLSVDAKRFPYVRVVAPGATWP